MPFHQLNPQIPVMTDRGGAQAVAIIDYSEEHDLKWVCFLDSDGSCWTFPNSKVRAFPNYSMGRVFKPKLNTWTRRKKKNSLKR